MKFDSTIYIAGHTGLVGSALVRCLKDRGYFNLITRTHAEMDLTRQEQVEAFFSQEKPEYVFLAAAKVGGIMANSTYKAEFIYQNLMIAANVIHAAYKSGVTRLLNLGSSCIYPKLAAQPLKEESLLTGPLEPTNEPYAIAKIAAIKLCRYYNEQYGTNYISLMPTNLYGPNDNFNLKTSHVLPALIRKFHLAKLACNGDWEAIGKDEARFGTIPADIRDHLIALSHAHGFTTPYPSLITINDSLPAMVLWGSGAPRREFLYVDDLAEACVFVMSLPDSSALTPNALFELFNVGVGTDLTIRELAMLVKNIVGYEGDVIWDTTKPDGTPQKLLDLTRITELGWEAKTKLEEGIMKTYNSYVNEPNITARLD
jgi:GDP-L-fucose synthase